MRIAYLDCFAGISGDMFLGALLDVGVSPQVLHDATAALNLGASLKIETVDRSGISCTKVHVMENGHLAEEKTQGYTHSHETGESHTHPQRGEQDSTLSTASFEHQRSEESMPHTHQPKTQHLHKAGQPHSHDHEPHQHDHVHGRSLTAIRALIKDAPLDHTVKQTAIRAFELLGRSEAKIHNVPIDEIHFHEVGAVDAIVDIVAASAGIHSLAIDAWYCSPLNIGGGMVNCAHGTFPVPAPATADLLQGIPTYSAHVQKELVTPTGAALIRALDPNFGQQPAMRVERIGYGAGTRNPKGFPNVLRIQIGEAAQVDPFVSHHPSSAYSADPVVQTRTVGESAPDRRPDQNAQYVTVLETALDDLSPQVLAHVAEMALEKGALDVMLTPIIMKKGRPGTLLTVLCAPTDSHAFEDLILRETSTLGVRIRQDRRICLDRRHITVQTGYGDIRVKVGSLSGEELNATPEFEDCRAAATRHNVPLKEVQQAAIAAYLR